MPLHLLKLCVGCDSVEDLRAWIAARRDERRVRGEAFEQVHTTRMVPRRAADILDGGSLYWVIRGSVQARQALLDIRPFTDTEGIGRCRLVLQPEPVETRPQPRRPFQGWRYLSAADAPADLGGAGDGLDALPRQLRTELAELGLL